MERRAAIYLRVSTDHQSTELQKIEIIRFIESKNWQITCIYEDHLSGSTVQRPGLQALLKDARAKKFNVIVTYRLDRFFRSLKDLLITLHELQEIGIDFVSIREQIDLTTSIGRLMVHLLGAIGQFERELLNSRINAGLANAKRKGIRLGRPQTVNRDDVLILRRQGLSLFQIAKKLNCSKSAVHKTLSQMSVQKSFKNIEIIENQKLGFKGQKSLDLKTNAELPKGLVSCHRGVDSCHEHDLYVSSDTKGFKK